MNAEQIEAVRQAAKAILLDERARILPSMEDPDQEALPDSPEQLREELKRYE